MRNWPPTILTSVTNETLAAVEHDQICADQAGYIPAQVAAKLVPHAARDRVLVGVGADQAGHGELADPGHGVGVTEAGQVSGIAGAVGSEVQPGQAGADQQVPVILLPSVGTGQATRLGEHGGELVLGLLLGSRCPWGPRPGRGT